MNKFAIILCFGAALLFQSSNHGGKIETTYDGFNYETVMRLRKMKVSCDGFRDKFKDSCVSIEVTLHCPGSQMNYVRNVTWRVVFENKDWVHFHAPEQRDLSIVTDSETLSFGRMMPVSKDKTGSWDTKVETLEATIPYAAFKKIVSSQSIAIQVGRDSVMLREKNLAALQDLNSRVIVAGK